MAMSAQHAHGSPTSPIAQYMMRGPYTQYLPGCSFAQHGTNQPVTVSNAMLQAYNKMRGPGVDGGEDPLFEWIQLRGDVKAAYDPQAPRNKQDVTHMLAKVDEALLSGNATGDSPRDSFFELQRPPSHHLWAPSGHDLSTHAFAACCGDFVLEPEMDDEGGNSYMPSGRISPCTFLAWSKGCRRWNKPNIAPDDATTKQRQRPPSPERTETPPAQPRPSRYPQHGFRQFDEEGCELSPHYTVPTSPSILYTAEGIDADRVDAPAFETRYARMDPFAAKALRKLKCGHYTDTSSASPNVSSEKYSYREVEEVAEQFALPEALGFPSTAAMASYLDGQYALIAQAEEENEALDAQLREQLAQVHKLEEEREELKLAVELLREAHAHASQQQQQQQHASTACQKRRRQHRMCHHITTHVRDVAYKQQASLMTVKRLRAQKEGNAMAIAGIQSDILRLCFDVGKVYPLEVFEALAHASLPVDELVHRMHRRSQDEQETSPHALAGKPAGACPGNGFELQSQAQCKRDGAGRGLSQNQECRDSPAAPTPPAKLPPQGHYGQHGPPPLYSPDIPELYDEATDCGEDELDRVMLEAEAFIARLMK